MFHIVLNPAASAFPVACCGVSERMGNIIIPYGSKILRSLLRRASIGKLYHYPDEQGARTVMSESENEEAIG
jgi:hypothetical protein